MPIHYFEWECCCFEYLRRKRIPQHDLGSTHAVFLTKSKWEPRVILNYGSQCRFFVYAQCWKYPFAKNKFHKNMENLYDVMQHKTAKNTHLPNAHSVTLVYNLILKNVA